MNDFVGKFINVKARNGKMVEYQIVDYEEYSETRDCYTAVPAKKRSDDGIMFSSKYLLEGIQNKTIEFVAK